MMAMLSCPLCCQSYFSSVDLLRTSLISVINGPLICPICNDIQHSLDDLATHLTKHIEVPSQMGCHTMSDQQQHDANKVIQNININNTTNNNSETKSGVNQFNRMEPPSKCIESPSMPHKLDPSPPTVSLCKLEPSSISNAQINQMAEPLFVCHLCDCSFRSQELQQMHLQLVHEINVHRSNQDSGKLSNAHIISPTMLQCNLCPKRFNMIGSLRLHVRMVHKASKVPSSPPLPSLTLQKVCNKQNAVVAKCVDNNLVQSIGNNENELGTGEPMTTRTKPSTTLHVNSTNLPLIHNNQCDYYSNYGLNDVVTFGSSNGNSNSSTGSGTEQTDFEGLSNGNNNSKEMIASTEDRVHKCDICNKRFTTKYFLKKHKRLHTGEMPYTCELCHRTFTFQQSYHRHLSYHTNDRPHSCSICGRAFKELSTLHNHQRIHSGEKPFECETCGKCFRQRVSYLVHRRIHTGVMPYNCVTCDKKFRYKISLRTHKCSGFIASTLNENDTAFINDNDQEQNMLTCSQTLDELITESCNRMGIVDQSDSNPPESSTMYVTTENGNIHSNQSMIQFDCDSFNLNDLTFCTGETSNTDLANVMPSMNEIFPQSIEILNALYDNVNENNNDLQNFYDSSTQQYR